MKYTYFNLEFCASWLGSIPVIQLKIGPEVHHRDLHIKSTGHWMPCIIFMSLFSPYSNTLVSGGGCAFQVA